MFRRVLASAVLAVFALTGARAATSDALKLHGNRLFVQVTVNGVEAEALLDSAAEITESLPCKVEGIETQADIDLGNGSDVLIGKAFAEKHGLLKAERIVEHKEGGGIGGAVVRDIVVLSSLEVAGVKFENVRAAIDPQDSAGEVNIGTSILRRFVLVIDYSGHAVWLKPN